MKIRMILPVVIALTTGGVALAQQGQPGLHFVENWDLDENGQVTLAEVQEKRGDLFYMFDQDENGKLNDVEYALFDETRQADMDENAGGHNNGQMRGVNTGLTLEFNDTDGDGLVSEEEFVTKTADWFGNMDSNGDGFITTDDFGRGRG
ncbi:MAG: EF-hand domain-containing protein [Marinosulfonomonas sp.]|nr:EF-hand domain-containing protein [Marinosulfonomonas sp.]